jgi:hypothetical protein
MVTVFAAGERSTLRGVGQARKARKERLREGKPVVAHGTGPCGLYLRKAGSAKLLAECREITSNVARLAWVRTNTTILSPVASSVTVNGSGRHIADEAPAPPDQHGVVIISNAAMVLMKLIRDEDPCFRLCD